VKTKCAIFLMPLIVVIFLLPLGCSDNGQTDESKTIQATEQSRPEVPQKAEEGNSKEAGSAIKGGREVVIDPFTFSVPGDWKENRDSQMWRPPTEDDTKPWPDHYLWHGGRPSAMLEGFSGLLEGIKAHIGTEPQDVEKMKLGGMDAATCGWEKDEYQYIGLFLLEEKKIVDMEVLHFFICRAPKESFPQYETTFKAILKSVRL